MTRDAAMEPGGICRIDPGAVDLVPLDLDPGDFQSALPRQHYHTVFEDAAIGLSVGIWDTTTMQEAFGPYPTDEFITVLEGHFAMLDGAGRAVPAAAPQSVTFRHAIPVSWKQEGYLRKIYLTLRDPAAVTPEIASAEGGVRAFDPGRGVVAAPGPDGIARECLFRNDVGTMTVTHALYPALLLPPAPCGAHVLARILAGALTLHDAAGRTSRFEAGTHVFVPRGTVCGWQFTAGTAAFMAEVTA